MPVPDGYREAVAYIQLEKRAGGPYGRAYPGRSEATASRMTTKKPDSPIPGAVVVKVVLQVPDAAFEPLTPEAVVRVPEDLTQRPVHVDAADPQEN